MIRIYTQPGCQPCRAVERIVAKSGVGFAVINVANDPVGQKFVTETVGARQTPVVVRDWPEDYIIGFRPESLKQMIEREKNEADQVD